MNYPTSTASSTYSERWNFGAPNYTINKRGRTMSAATRQRRYRARRKAGRRVFQIEVDEVELAIMLEALNFLDPLDADDDEAVERGLNDMVQVLCRGLA
ncbi:UNVERIFIED_ORG: hypothetical protein GGE44_000229 [Rhizobium esperanzae]